MEGAIAMESFLHPLNVVDFRQGRQTYIMEAGMGGGVGCSFTSEAGNCMCVARLVCVYHICICLTQLPLTYSDGSFVVENWQKRFL